MADLIRKGELATLAGVAPSSVTCALRGPLGQALTPDRRRLYRDHPEVKRYIAKRSRHRRDPEIAPPARPDPPPPPPAPPVTNAADPFAALAQAATMGSGVVRAAAPSEATSSGEPTPAWETGSLEQHTSQYLYDVERGIPGALPEGVRDIGDLTLREIVERFGRLEHFRDAVKAMQLFADMRNKESIAKVRRGEHIDRAVVTGTLIPLIDLATTRLVTEAPQALAEQVVARVLAGGDDLTLDVEELIREENSGILTDCRDGFVREFDKLAGAEPT